MPPLSKFLGLITPEAKDTIQKITARSSIFGMPYLYHQPPPSVSPVQQERSPSPSSAYSETYPDLQSPYSAPTAVPEISASSKYKIPYSDPQPPPSDLSAASEPHSLVNIQPFPTSSDVHGPSWHVATVTDQQRSLRSSQNPSEYITGSEHHKASSSSSQTSEPHPDVATQDLHNDENRFNNPRPAPQPGPEYADRYATIR
jgi:hypothetical protein